MSITRKSFFAAVLLSSAVGLATTYISALSNPGSAFISFTVAFACCMLSCLSLKLFASERPGRKDYLVMRRNGEGKIVWIGLASEAGRQRRKAKANRGEPWAEVK